MSSLQTWRGIPFHAKDAEIKNQNLINDVFLACFAFLLLASFALEYFFHARNAKLLRKGRKDYNSQFDKRCLLGELRVSSLGELCVRILFSRKGRRGV